MYAHMYLTLMNKCIVVMHGLTYLRVLPDRTVMSNGNDLAVCRTYSKSGVMDRFTAPY